MSGSYRGLQVRENCFFALLPLLFRLFCLFDNLGWWTHCCEHLGPALLCLWASQGTKVCVTGKCCMWTFCQARTKPFQLFLVLVVYGQGMLPWKLASHLSKLSLKSELGYRHLPSFQESFHCGPAAPLRICLHFEGFCSCVFIPLKLKWGEKNITYYKF